MVGNDTLGELKRQLLGNGKVGLYLRMAIVVMAIGVLYMVVVLSLWGWYAAKASGQLGFYLAIPICITVALIGVLYWYRLRDIREDTTLLSEADAPEVHRLVDELVREMDVPKPELRLSGQEEPNAYAAGRREKGVVVLTEPILELLDEEELQSVLAHELAHIDNRDTIVMIAADATRKVIVQTVRWLTKLYLTVMMMVLSMADEDPSQKDIARRHRRKKMMVGAMAGFFSALVLVFSRSLSRHREFVADAAAVRAVGDSEPLASALTKIDDATSPSETVTGNTPASLYFVAKVDGFLQLIFRTHPSPDRRVEMLKSVDP